MACNSFGRIFRITTFGESHGSAIGVVVDGCPAGLPITNEEIDEQLARRRPGFNAHTSPRKEEDHAEILSGLFEGVTTGAPITIIIRNRDTDSSTYEAIKDLFRPGHANYTYLSKYGIFDYRGGGRASARETAARVAAGAIAKKFLSYSQIHCVAYLSEVGGIAASLSHQLQMAVNASPIFCPDRDAEQKIMERIAEVREEGDSVGGIVGCMAQIPVGLGDPIYGKLEAQLASAMLSLPATKGFEIGSGFAAARQKGSEHNDAFDLNEHGETITRTNFSGGTLGGISTGAPLFFRVAFKPTASIRKEQRTVSLKKERTTIQLSQEARHDPCVAIRAVPVVEAMTNLVLADAVLLNRCSRIYL